MNPDEKSYKTYKKIGKKRILVIKGKISTISGPTRNRPYNTGNEFHNQMMKCHGINTNS
jgi:hypothetical protein